MGVIKLSRTTRQIALAVICATSIPPTASALPPPSPSPPVFEDRPFGPKPAPTRPQPSVVRSEAPRPIPRKWILAGAAVGAVVGGALLLFGIRAWRTSRLFGRQYRFPVRERVALRLGGERSGGLVAAASFAGNSGRAAEPGSKAKDA